MTASPSFSINGGSSLADAQLAASGSVTATLDSLDGVRIVQWSIVGTDETSVPGDYTLTPSGFLGSTVTFNALGAGTAAVLKCKINAGIDSRTENPSSATAATAVIWVPTAAGNRVRAEGEDSSATFRDIRVTNALARAQAQAAVAARARVAAVSNITLSGHQTIDGKAVTDGDVVLSTAQSLPAKNGLWTVAAGAWTRASSADVAEEFPGLTVAIEEGTTYGGTLWQCTTPNPITLETTTLTFVVLPGATDKARIDTLYNNDLTASVSLTDASQTIAIAGGRRRSIPGALLTTNRLYTLGVTGAVLGDTISVERHDTTVNSAIFLDDSGAVLTALNGPGAAQFRFDGSHFVLASISRKGQPHVLNVRAYGARGDDNASTAAAELSAIQSCIDAAKAAIGVLTHGVTVYFPSGIYRITGGSLKLPRSGVLSRFTIEGEGRDSSFLYRDDAALVLEPDTSLANTAQGFVSLNRMTIGGTSGTLFNWDFGDNVDFGSGAFRCTLHCEDVLWRAGTSGTTVAAIHIFGGQNCKFIRNHGYGLSGNGGVLLEYNASSFLTMIDCGLEGTSGALVRATSQTYMGSPKGGGTHVLVNCRGEGGFINPELYFELQNGITLIHCSNEGVREYPAAFRFVNCDDINLQNCSIATSDSSYAVTSGVSLTFDGTAHTITRGAGSFLSDGFTSGQNVKITGSASNNGNHTLTGLSATVMTFASGLVNETIAATLEGNVIGDGISLENCQNVRGSVTIPNAFFGATLSDARATNGFARAIRVKSDCKQVSIEGRFVGSAKASDDVTIQNGANDAHITVGTASNGNWPTGRKTVDRLDSFWPVLTVNYNPDLSTGRPSAYCGLSVHRGGNVSVPFDQAAIWWDDSVDSFRCVLNTAGDQTTLGNHLPFIASEFDAASGAPWTAKVSTGQTFDQYDGSTKFLQTFLASGFVQVVPSTNYFIVGPGSVDVQSATTLTLTGAAIVLSNAPTTVNSLTANRLVRTDGSKILGSAAQDSRVGQLTDSTGGSTSSNSGALVDVGGAFDQTKLNDNLAKLAAKINAIETAIHNAAVTT